MEREKAKARSGQLAEAVGRKLHALRIERDLTLEGLARISGVSRAMLWQIERARSAPTITVLSRVAEALGVPVSAFLDGAPVAASVVLRRCDARVLQDERGTVATRALFPVTGARSVEFHEVRLMPGAREELKARRDGTCENIVVCEGAVEIQVGQECHLLQAGDALFLRADVPHGYRNVTAQSAVLYRVTAFPSAVTYD